MKNGSALILAISLTLIVITIALSGCGSSEPEPEPVTMIIVERTIVIMSDPSCSCYGYDLNREATPSYQFPEMAIPGSMQQDHNPYISAEAIRRDDSPTILGPF